MRIFKFLIFLNSVFCVSHLRIIFTMNSTDLIVLVSMTTCSLVCTHFLFSSGEIIRQTILLFFLLNLVKILQKAVQRGSIYYNTRIYSHFCKIPDQSIKVNSINDFNKTTFFYYTSWPNYSHITYLNINGPDLQWAKWIDEGIKISSSVNHQSLPCSLPHPK